jgi:hypothetical protein
MRHEVSMELYAYWNGLRAGRSAPERNDVEPSAIRAILADTFVLDIDAQMGFPFRICGSRVNALFLREMRGLSFLKLWRKTDQSEIRSVLERVGDKAQPCLLGAEARPTGLDPLEIEIALLPLRHNGSTQSRMLGSLAAVTASQWVGLVGAGSATLTSVKSLHFSAPAAAAGAAGGVSAPSSPKQGGTVFVFSHGERKASRRGTLTA